MISGYFSKRQAELKMPTGPDSVGIRWEGAVMEGRMTVDHRFAQERREAAARQVTGSAAGPREYVRERPPLVGGKVPR